MKLPIGDVIVERRSAAKQGPRREKTKNG